jgi:hypothetical protein
VSKDAGQLVRAVASLAGLALAIAAAVGVGSMMGETDNRIPLSQDPGTSGAAVDPAGDPGSADDALDAILGGSSGSQSNGTTSGGNGNNSGTPSQGKPGDKTPNVDVELPDDDVIVDTPDPVKVPPTLAPDEIQGVLDDITGGEAPKPESLLDKVTGALLDTNDGLLGSTTKKLGL